ncbi:2-oxoadipate dioxygenase/decarboxylase family protein [Caulobacter sp. S45]|uniref:2-oxoadipate dioxygenase/decarboxylase family protein n=1 Tax=Caulobacter sp. S45 TaxID=1641861 RepID=UPI00157715E6|nr:DUF1338 family protein [Caulobacter sp. S45]
MGEPPQLHRLVETILGHSAARDTLEALRMSPALLNPSGADGRVSRAVAAMALNILLFHDLLARAPTAAAYVADRRADGAGVVFDHGALRTIRFKEGPTGALPPGEAAFTRVLEPLGYALAGVYPLDRLGMTGRAYAQEDFPEDVPQFFLSELHVDRFSAPFQAAAHAVFDSSSDPLDPVSLADLGQLRAKGELEMAAAIRLLSVLASVFGRRHAVPRLADYRTLLGESAEAAWIATEGNAFNHATDRVSDVDALAQAQRALGRPMKPAVEISASGRVRQTAFRADPVERSFLDDSGGEVRMSAPGSFYEFITRDVEAEAGRIDLRFDSSNAQGIFKMTQVQGA